MTSPLDGVPEPAIARTGQPDGEGPGYAEAMLELESILRALEDDDLDVDALAARVARAADLIRWCRARITGARLQVEQVVTDLEADGPTPPTT